PPQPATLDALLAELRLSISGFNQYLRCPLSFYYERVLRLPSVTSEYAAYGLAMHEALHRGFGQMLQHPERAFPPPEDFARHFDRALKRRSALFGEQAFRRYLEKGRHNLQAYVLQQRDTWCKNVKLELLIRDAVVDGVPLIGIIDKVEFPEPGIAHVVDYKTGSHRADKLRPPSDKEPHGGPYWRQLVFYKLLYESASGKRGVVRSGEIAYLDPDKQGHFPTHPLELDAAAADFLRELLRETYQRILDRQFFEGCNEPHCHWCKLLNRQYELGSLADALSEELDDPAR
ncbi:MAG: PD-(D/E)XK nuclease family protein, partial [Bacteroidetes bacterium]